jgi:DNA replication protein DnaT
MSWLKIETHTPTKPEMSQLARLCHCSKGDVFLACFRLWSWADSQSEDGWIEFLTPDDVDEHAGMKGFGAALEAVKWIVFSDGGAMIPNFDRHCGQSAKKRAMKSERQRRWRQSVDAHVDAQASTHVDAHVDAAPSTREEKRR